MAADIQTDSLFGNFNSILLLPEICLSSNGRIQAVTMFSVAFKQY